MLYCTWLGLPHLCSQCVYWHFVVTLFYYMSMLCLFLDIRVQFERCGSFSSCYTVDSDDCEKRIPKY